MEEEQQQDELRMSEILSVVWKRIVWILVISVIAALVCAVVVMYSLNPSKEKYQLSFRIEYPNQYVLDNDGVTDKLQYPDGTAFRIDSVIYADRLNAAKKSDEAFENVDTDKMVSLNQISIRANSNGSYTLTVAAPYFKNSEEASKFLKAVLEVTRQSIIENAEEKDCYPELIGYESAFTVDDQLSILKNRRSDLLSTYNVYRGTYGKFSYDFGEDKPNIKKLEDCYKDVSDVKVESLIRAVELEHKWEANETLIESLESKGLDKPTENGGAPEAYLNALVNRNSYESELKKIYADLEYSKQIGTLFDADNDWLANKIAALKGEIETQTETLNTMITALYESKTMFIPEPDSVRVTGGVSTTTYTVIAFVAAFIVASFVFCVWDISRKRKGTAAEKEGELHEVQEPKMLEEPQTKELHEVEEVKEEEPAETQEEKPEKKKSKKE